MDVAQVIATPGEGALEFDPHLPPAEPPAGCVDVVTWRRA
jgi:hypothetical protein